MSSAKAQRVKMSPVTANVYYVNIAFMRLVKTFTSVYAMLCI